jgi:hypothetical protein
MSDLLINLSSNQTWCPCCLHVNYSKAISAPATRRQSGIQHRRIRTHQQKVFPHSFNVLVVLGPSFYPPLLRITRANLAK